MAEAKAWLLSLGHQLQATIGHHHMMEYIIVNEIKIINLPLIFEYSPGVMVWNSEIIPLIDLALFAKPKSKVGEAIRGVIIVAYQDAAGEPLKNAGLLLRASPKEVIVTSEMACQLPTGITDWQAIADASCEIDETQTPVLKLEQVFGTELRDEYARKLKLLQQSRKDKSSLERSAKK